MKRLNTPRHKGSWATYCTLSDLPVFYHPDWLDAASGEHEWDVAILRDSDNQIRAGWPYLAVRKAFFRALLNPPLTSYLGPVAAGGLSPEDFDALYKNLPRHILLEQKTNPDHPLPVYSIRSLKRIPSPTYFLSLDKAENDLLAGMKESTRRQIRKAEKQCLFTEGDPYTLTRLIESELRPAIDRQLPSEDALLKMFSMLTGRYGLLLEAYINEQPVAAMALVRNFKSWYYLIGVQNNTGRAAGAMSGLMWYAIRELKMRGVPVLDFEGSSIPSIARFFAGFGAEVGVQITLRERSPLLRLIGR